mmetsp:Transcript_57537/g.153701  ORF Transcript_57537/g.153701 Transcript_57537/m.153701 type:complete len:232 (-) Transcript_57537:1394-2089(-)
MLSASSGGETTRTPWPPASSQATTGTFRGMARGSLATASWSGFTISAAARRVGAPPSNAGSPIDCSGVHTNLARRCSAGICGGRATWSSSSAPPATGTHLGSACVGPSSGHRLYQSSADSALCTSRAWRAAADWPNRPCRPCCRAWSIGFVLPWRLFCGAARSGARLHVKPLSTETRTSTADVIPWLTTEPSGECTTGGVVNSRVSTSTILPGTIKSQRGELDFSRTLTGM